MTPIPKNLIVALIALGMYGQCNNINLANNTTILIIVLALLLEQKEIEDVSHQHTVETQNYQTNYHSGNCQNYQVATPYNYGGYPTGYIIPYAQEPYCTNYHSQFCGYNFYPQNRCGCNTVVY